MVIIGDNIVLYQDDVLIILQSDTEITVSQITRLQRTSRVNTYIHGAEKALYNVHS